MNEHHRTIMQTEEPDDPLNTSSADYGLTDITIHPFNENNVTVIEKPMITTCGGAEGSDSGVEVLEPSDSHNTSYQRLNSCDSSIISGCSNYDEAFNILVRRNSTLFEGYTRTSDNGSESSSVTGSSSSRNSKQRPTTLNTRKRVEDKSGGRSRSKPPLSVKRTTDHGVRLKNAENASANVRTRPTSATRTSSATRTPAVTPTDDGRWPSVNSKPAPLMSRSIRQMLDSKGKTVIDKSIEKYATLPRRKKESHQHTPAADKKTAREESINRLAQAKRTSTNPPPQPPQVKLMYSSSIRKKAKVRIYHEFGVQTALTAGDIDKALAGQNVTHFSPSDAETCDLSVQVDIGSREVEDLNAQLRELSGKYESLSETHKVQGDRLKEAEGKLAEQKVENQGLKDELKINSQRVLAILGEASNESAGEMSTDSLMILEARFQNVSQIVIRQEDEISKLNNYCRNLQIDLEKSIATQRILVQQQQELQAESSEMQDFLQDEKSTLADALKEHENEIMRLNQSVKTKDKELKEQQEECRRLATLSEQRWQENLSLQGRMGALEAKSRDLLVHQGSSVSGTAVALSALTARLEGLVDELVQSYNISDQELEDVIFHNEAYSNSSSSPDVTPERSNKTISNNSPPPPKKGSSFVSAVINAIKNATAQSPFVYRDYNNSNKDNPEDGTNNELLDSETEPCLMMEPVLENVVIPDGHSQNMISSCHSLIMNSSTHSDMSRASFEGCDIFPSFSLIDQVIDVDNLVTRLLKVIRIIQMEGDDCMNDLEEQRDVLSQQVNKQKETTKLVGKQLKDWELLGARLKSEVKELMQQISRKNTEIDNIKGELNNQREQVEKLNQDVCELSTALAKAEFEVRIKEEEVGEAIKNWEADSAVPNPEVLGRLMAAQNNVCTMRDKMEEKDRQLTEIAREFLSTRQILSESLKAAVTEAKKQYEAIDNALEVLHNNQNIVQQCTPLAELQRDLENISFQSASAMPLPPSADYNANAALLQAIASLQLPTPIDTSA